MERWSAAVGWSLARSVVAVMLGIGAGAAAAQPEFPFGRELVLDASPMRGSKRVPVLDIADDGTADIELWCSGVRGQFVVAAETVTVITGPKEDRECSPERQQGDDDILDILQQVTTWRWQGESFVLVGPRSIRFRLQTN